MQKVFIFGNNSFAEQMTSFLLSDSRYQLAGYLLSEQYIKSDKFLGLPVFAFEKYADINRDVQVINCVGYSKMLDNRADIHGRLIDMGFNLISYISPLAQISTGVKIGRGNVIFPYAIIEFNSNIGDGNVFYANSQVCHDVQIGDFNWLSAQSLILGYTNISTHCFVGGNATVKNNLRIEGYTLVGAGAYLRFDTEKYDVVVPGESIKLQGKSSVDIMLK